MLISDGKEGEMDDLKPGERERFAMLAEEASEVVQICMKILRHGAFSHNPNDRNETSNKELLMREITDFQAVFMEMISEGHLRPVNKKEIKEVLERKKYFIHHDKQLWDESIRQVGMAATLG